MFTTRAMDGAAAAGHLPMVAWLHEQGHGCTTAAMDLAAQGGHLEIVQVGQKRDLLANPNPNLPDLHTTLSHAYLCVVKNRCQFGASVLVGRAPRW